MASVGDQMDFGMAFIVWDAPLGLLISFSWLADPVLNCENVLLPTQKVRFCFAPYHTRTQQAVKEIVPYQGFFWGGGIMFHAHNLIFRKQSSLCLIKFNHYGIDAERIYSGLLSSVCLPNNKILSRKISKNPI